jgi:cell division septal protein FtsQ
VSKLLSPRAGARDLSDLGERSSLVGAQRVGRARRRRSRPRAEYLPVLVYAVIAAVLTAGAAAGVHWLFVSPRFAVREIDVRGASRLPVERIVEAADVPAGLSLFRVDPTAVAARVAALPEVRRVDVVRELPNRLAIVVEERRPFTLVHSGRLHWIDEEGRTVGEERRAVVSAMPLITGLSDEEIASMRTAPTVRARGAIALIQTLLRSGSTLIEEIAEIDVSRPEGPVLHTMDGVEVRLGTEEWSDRLARLEGVLAQVARDDATVNVVDLRFRDQVVLGRGGKP